MEGLVNSDIQLFLMEKPVEKWVTLISEAQWMVEVLYGQDLNPLWQLQGVADKPICWHCQHGKKVTEIKVKDLHPHLPQRPL